MSEQTKERRTGFIGAYVEPGQQRRLAELARVNERSVSGEIRRAINAHLRSELEEEE
jgi:hypothetical protein